MPVPKIPLPPRQRRERAPAGESFLFKSMLVASVLFFSAIVMVEMEFYVSAPAHSLSEAEVMLRTAAN
jgi:hypothetical protein